MPARCGHQLEQKQSAHVHASFPPLYSAPGCALCLTASLLCPSLLLLPLTPHTQLEPFASRMPLNCGNQSGVFKYLERWLHNKVVAAGTAGGGGGAGGAAAAVAEMVAEDAPTYSGGEHLVSHIQRMRWLTNAICFSNNYRLPVGCKLGGPATRAPTPDCGPTNSCPHPLTHHPRPFLCLIAQHRCQQRSNRQRRPPGSTQGLHQQPVLLARRSAVCCRLISGPPPRRRQWGVRQGQAQVEARGGCWRLQHWRLWQAQVSLVKDSEQAEGRCVWFGVRP